MGSVEVQAGKDALTGHAGHARVGLLRNGRLTSAVFAALAIGLVVPATAGATVTGSVTGNAATLTSDGSGDFVRLASSGGLLAHFGVPLTVGGFNSDFDWDSSTAGDQTLGNDGTSSVTYNGAGGDDELIVGGNGNPSSGILAPVTFDGGANTDLETVQDSSATAPRNVTVTSTAVSPAGLAARPYSNVEDLEVETGHANDIVNIASTAPLTKTNAFMNAGDDLVAVADGVDVHNGKLDGASDDSPGTGTGSDTLDFSA